MNDGGAPIRPEVARQAAHWLMLMHGNELDSRQQQAMGEASRAVFANGSVPWRRARASVV